MTPITRLRAIAGRLIERDDPEAAWFSAVLQEYEAGARHGMTLEQAFGLACAPGERPWWHAEACERRDALLRDLAERQFPALSARGAAEAIVTALTRYETTAWRRDRAYLSPPEGLRGDLFRLLRLEAPLSEGTIRRALTGSRDIPIRAPRASAV